MNNEIAGTPEDMKLTVKQVGTAWIVENNLGESVGSAPQREEAIAMAKECAAAQKASVISVQDAQGATEQTIDV